MKRYIRSSNSFYKPTINGVSRAIRSLKTGGFKIYLTSNGVVAITPEEDHIYGWYMKDIIDGLIEEPVSSYTELREMILDILYSTELEHEEMPYDLEDAMDVIQKFKTKYLN